ncbi:MAG: conjugal transfer protein TraG N-terminal domain-containing protein [Candidatus Thiodiazotropha sp.]
MPIWEIYTYGNGEFLALIFNGVVALLGDSNFTTLMRLAGIFGLMWVSIKAALYRGPVEWTYLIWFVLIYGVLFVPKVDVVIVDRLDNNQTRVVANVPWGLGAFAGTTARIGDWFTRSIEAVMTQPDDLKYQRNGVVFGSTLVEAASQYEITDGRFSANMSEFMRQCVFYDVLFRRYTWTDILEAEDTWEFIRTNTASTSRAFAYTASDGARSIIPCRTGAQGVLTADWNVEIDRAQRLYGIRFNPHLNMTDAAAKLMADIPVSYDYLAGISSSGGDIIRANMMANLFRRSFGNAAAAADASAAAQDFALAQAERQQLQTYQVMGKLAAKLLPMLKNIYEGLLYGMFPFLFLIFMLPIGVKIFLAYLKNVVWLQLWAPLYAILNLLMTLGAQKYTTAAAAQLGEQALSLATHSGLAFVNTETAVIAGYIGLSIPLIAYGLVSGGQMALSQLAAQVGAVAQVAANQASASSSTGNINLATLGAYNTGMFKNDTNPLTNYGQGHYNDLGGNTHTLGRGGAHGQTNLKTDLGTNAELAEAVQFAKRDALSNLEQATRTEARQYANGLSGSLNTAMDMSRSTGFGFQKSDGWNQQDTAAWSRMAQQSKEISQQLQDRYGFSQEQADKITYTAAADLHANADLRAGGPGGQGMSGGVGVAGQLRVQGDHTEIDKLTQAYETARSALDRQTVNKGVEALENYGRTTNYQATESGGNELSSRLYSSLQDTQSAEQRWQRAHTEQVQAQQEWSKVGTDSQSIRTNLIPEFAADMRASGHSQAQVLLSDPTRSRELAQVTEKWAANKFGGAFAGDEAASRAIEHVTNPGYGQAGFAMGQRQESAIKVSTAQSALEHADLEYQRTVAGEGSVRHTSAQHEHQVLHKSLSSDSPHSGAAARGLSTDKLGQTPFAERPWVEDFKETVNTKSDQDLGQASLEISEASGHAAGERHLRKSEVEENIEEGKKDTKDLW